MDKEISGLLQPAHFERITSLWDGELTPVPVDEVQNLVYDFKCGGRELILRLTHSGHRSEEDVISELDFVNYLHRNGVRVCPPVPSKEGKLTEVLPVEGGYFIAAVFKKAPGRTVDSDDHSVWNPDFFHRWGMLVGRLHSLAKRYEPGPFVKRRPRWNPRNLIPKARARLPESKKGMVYEIGSILDRIEIIPRDPDRFGLIHDDLNTTNFLVDGGRSLCSISTTAPTAGLSATWPHPCRCIPRRIGAKAGRTG